MIFITLGSQKFQFNRLLKSVDELISKQIIKEKVYAQIGYSDYIPKNYEYTDFLNRISFENKMRNASLVITHAGTGAIVTALKNKKKVIAMPRKSRFGEHVDDHQEEISNIFSKKDYIFVANNLEELEIKIDEISDYKFTSFESNNKKYIEYIGELYGE